MRKAGAACMLVIWAMAVLALVPSCGTGDDAAPRGDTSTSTSVSVAEAARHSKPSSSVAESSSEPLEKTQKPEVASEEAPHSDEDENSWQVTGQASADFGGEYVPSSQHEQQANGEPASSGASESNAQSKSGASAEQQEASASTGPASSDAGDAKQASEQEPAKDEPAPSNDSKPEPQPQKKWVDAVYETVEHPEEGHYETVVTGHRYFCLCGLEVGSPEGWKQHRADFIASNGGVCNGQHVSYSIEDITEEQYVVDNPAWTEQVLVSEGHWE